MTPAEAEARELTDPYRVKRIHESLLTRPADRTWTEWAAAIDQNNTTLDYLSAQIAAALLAAAADERERIAQALEQDDNGWSDWGSDNPTIAASKVRNLK